MDSSGDSSRESTRERILRKAAELFAERGFHGTSVARIGEAAEVQRGALYYHIGSKENLLYDLSKRHVEEALVRGRAVVASDLPPVEKMRRLAFEHLSAVAARRAEVTVVMREMHALTGDRAERLRALRDEHQSLFKTVLQEGVDLGVFREADSVSVLGILGALNWTYVWFDPARGLGVEALAERLTDMILHGQLTAEAASTEIDSGKPVERVIA
ncbi:putative transcriptional regulator, TetR family protein [Pseudonocardia sulfidoxydans NBRC 16205]|uniref:Putative transcriptional regulator, TetR family protein n=2 Tax=Pseudonocardia sulfidoxydans TaxID=54011 RepID=A0A511DLU8_9PSEU|nr:putative transcriptional regulator, TetR family protein [Pseudonocardia sulfidoxydans NBRC 16205]